MKGTFNNAANTYDNDFTHLFTGKQQRNVVWRYLNSAFPRPIHILEINCGTGEDAFYLSKHGHTVLATDISYRMIEVAQEKAGANSFGMHPQFIVCSYDNLHTLDRKFDLIFSNFGGLNCISPQQLSELSATLSALLNAHGRLVAITMTPLCLWELIYFTCKLQFKKAFRRQAKNPVMVPVGGEVIPTWYFTPRQFVTYLGSEFKMIHQIPVGIAIPPPFMEPLVKRYPHLQPLLVKLEKRLGKFSFWANFSDHFLTDLQKK